MPDLIIIKNKLTKNVYSYLKISTNIVLTERTPQSNTSMHRDSRVSINFERFRSKQKAKWFKLSGKFLRTKFRKIEKIEVPKSGKRVPKNLN